MSGEALISAWGDHLRQDRRRSLHTVRAYVATAERLLAFLSVHQGGPPQLDAVEASDLRAFLARRRMEGLGNASAARELSAIRGFLAFAGGAEGVLGQLVRDGHPDRARDLARRLAALFPDRLYVELGRHPENGARRTPAEAAIEPGLVGIAHDLDLPLVAKAVDQAHTWIFAQSQGNPSPAQEESDK